jgi:protein involved in polysaccharide export with SLBB domain
VDVALQPRDEVHVFSLRAKREALIKPLIEQARLRSAPDKPVPEVGIEGVVHQPGVYPLSSGMRVSDLLRAAGGLTDRAYTVEAELTRFTVIAGKEREQSRLSVDVAAILKNESAHDTSLKAYDRLVIRRIPKWDEQGVIELAGEVRFPGKYPVVRNEKLSDVIKRAGGLTEQAYPKGSVFVRESVRQREQEHLERLAGKLEQELALFALQGPEVGVKIDAAVAEGKVLLRQLRSTKAAGRMVIKVDALLDGSERYDVIVQTGDKLYIPQRPQEVTVLGEVHYPTSHLFDKRASTSDYVDLSGGVTEKGNKRAIYVVHADGSVSVAGRWFRADPEPAPGDTVIVPLKVDRISSLKLFTDISTVIFQLAVTVAALNSIGIF